MKRLYVVAILILNLFSFTYGQGNLDYRPLESVGEIPAEFRSMTANKVRKAQIEEDHSDRTIREQRTVNDFLLRNNYFVDELLNSGKVLFGDPLSQYVNDVANKLLIQDEALKSKLRFYILKSDEVNAFATNVGVIFITVGLLAKIENEAQLAFVLAHEIAHVEKFHSIESVLAADKLLNGNRRDYSNYQSKIRVLSSFSREKEFEADSVGFFRYIKSGYSPEASSQMMDVLRENEMPLYEFAFDPSFLEIDQMQFPEEFVTFDI
ncbi:MAG: M48 family metallopeptidase, partial [Flavobacteriales bacterium]|nr:M48 family metallopeptidase [Flavobacteriales bacterium]